MSKESAQAATSGHLTMEDLFPDGNIGKQKTQPEAVETTPEETTEQVETDGEDLAEVQDTEEQADEVDDSSEATIGRMKLNEFLNAAGVSMEEFYRDVYVERDGKEVSVSEAWDAYKKVQDANDALLRERSELQKRVEQSAAAIPQQQIAPEAAALMETAKQYHRQLEAIMQDPNLANDPATANRKIDLQYAINGLVAQAQQKQMEWNTGQQEKFKQAIEERDRQTRAAIPEWNDANVQASEWRGIADMLASYGIHGSEIHRYAPAERRLLRDAWMAKNQTERIKQGAKKIRKVGKTLPSASRVPMKSKPSREETVQKIRSAKTRNERMKIFLSEDLD